MLSNHFAFLKLTSLIRTPAASYIRKPYKLMVGHFGDGSWSVEPTGRYLYNNDTNVIDMIEQEGTSSVANARM